MNPVRFVVAGLVVSSLAAPSFAAPPVTFERNEGQVDRVVRYMARGPRYALFLTPHEAVFRHHAADGDAVVRMSLTGARTNPMLTGERELATRSHYLRGTDRAAWRTGIPHYSAVRYAEVYHGIDLVFRGSGPQLEYDFVVSPGGNPNRIRMRFRGGETRLGAAGELIVRTARGALVHKAPVIYQEIEGKRKRVAGRYVRRGSDIGFAVDAYDRTLPLVIDPILAYTTFLGGTSYDEGLAIAVDSTGTYVAGETFSVAFPGVGSGSIKSTMESAEAFVTKLNPSGTAILYSTYLGGIARDGATGIAVDASGNAYVTGGTNGGFPIVGNAVQPKAPGHDSIFVAKINPTGSAILFSTYLGTGGATSIAVDSGANAYVAGWTTATIPGVTAASAQPAPGGSRDGFIAKLNANGSAILYATYVGGTAIDEANGIAVDAGGNAYVCGSTNSPSLPKATPGAMQPANAGNFDAFVAKIDPAGAAFLFSTFYGGKSTDLCSDIALDASGNAHFTGITSSTPLPGIAATSAQPARGGGSDDAFVAKINASGTAVQYATYVGGSGRDSGNAIAVDPAGRAHVAGHTESTDFPGVTAASVQPAHAGLTDAFAITLDAAGSAFDRSTYVGGAANDYAYAVAVDSAGNAAIAGTTYSTSLPGIDATSLQPASGGAQDVFVVTLGGSVSATCVAPPNTTMVAWYPFDEASGPSSANLATANTGAQHGGPSPVVGKVSRALRFNGVNQYIESPSSIVTNIGAASANASCSGSYSSCPGDFSIDAWIRVDPLGSSVLTILDKRVDTPNSVRGYHFFVYEGAIGLQLADDVGVGYSNYVSPVLTPALSDGSWHHVAVTVQRTSATGIAWYHNGAAAGTSNPTDRLGSLENGSPLRIGTRTAASALSGWFIGEIDELQIFNRALLPAEVAAIANAGAAGKCK